LKTLNIRLGTPLPAQPSQGKSMRIQLCCKSTYNNFACNQRMIKINYGRSILMHGCLMESNPKEINAKRLCETICKAYTNLPQPNPVEIQQLQPKTELSVHYTAIDETGCMCQSMFKRNSCYFKVARAVFSPTWPLRLQLGQTL